MSIERPTIEVHDVVVTEEPCEEIEGLEGITEQEMRFAELLDRATYFRLYGDRLFVQTEDHEALLFRAE